MLRSTWQPDRMTNTSTGWLTVAQLAQRLGVSPSTVYRMVEQRSVPYRRAPGTAAIRFAPDDVAANEDASRVRPLR